MADQSVGYFRGVVTGLLLGAAAALFLAPKPAKPGKKASTDLDNLKDKAEELGSSLAQSAQDLKERGADLLENAREQLEPTVEDAAKDATKKARDAAAQLDGNAPNSNHAHDVVDSV